MTVRRYAAGLLPALATVAVAAAPQTAPVASEHAPHTAPALSDDEQRAKLAESERWWAEADRLRKAGEPAAAAAAAERALAAEPAAGEAEVGKAESLELLAELYAAADNAAAATARRREALVLWARVHGDRHWRTMEARAYAADAERWAALDTAARRRLTEVDREHGRAMELYKAGRYREGIAPAEKALAVRLDLLGDASLATALSMSIAAGLHKEAGDLAAARPLFARAVVVMEKAIGPDHPWTAMSLSSLAGLHRAAGNLVDALPLLERALAISEKLGPDSLIVADRLNDLALLHQSAGDLVAAQPLYERALAIHEKSLGPVDPGTAASLNNLGGLHMVAGDLAVALPLLERALAIYGKVFGPDHPDTAASLNSLAVLHKTEGDYAAARPLYERALVIREKALGPDHPDTATSLNNLAVLYVAAGDLAAARPLLDRALAISERALGSVHPSTARSLCNLALLHLASGDPDRGLPLARRAVAAAAAHAEATAAVQSERQQLATAAAVEGYLSAYLSVAAAAGEPAGDTYALAMAWKGAVSARQRLIRAAHAAAAGGDLAAATAAAGLDAAARRLANLYAAAPPGDAAGRDRRRQQVEAASADVERRQVDLAGRSAAARRALAARRRGPAELAAALSAGVALVDVLAYDHYTPLPGDKGRGAWEPRLAAFVVRPGTQAVRVDLGPAAAVAAAADAWRLTLGGGAGGRAAGADLRRLVWAPLEPHLAGAATVLVSPDGPLCRVPLAALPGRRPGSYLLEDVAVSVVPVPRDIPDLLAARDRPAGDGLLVVGGVDYDAEPSGVTAAPTTGPATVPATRPAKPALALARSAARAANPAAAPWPALPGTAAEAIAISATWAARHAVTPQRLAGPAATEQGFRAAAPAARYVHLATHGYFADPTVPSALAPAARPADRDPGGDRPTIGWHPGLLSGVVLAGANRPADARRSAGGGDDGVLTALEVSELDLGGVDLAVLSACETGLGPAAGGEGLLGLQRAFGTAGARAVVAGQWKVDDAATAALMGEFYRNLWERKLPAGEALRRAQLALLNGDVAGLKAAAAARGLDLPPGEHAAAGDGGRLPPYYWAAFVLSGDWR